MAKLEIIRNKMKVAASRRTVDAIIKSIPPQLVEALTCA
jgi:hypothetical protein